MSEEDLVDELFRSLEKSNTARDIREAFKTLYAARETGAANIREVASQALQKLMTNANNLNQSGQYKKSAFHFFRGARVIHEFLPEEEEKEKEWLIASANGLIEAAKEHVMWKDVDGGAACMSIAALLRFLADNWNVEEFMGDFVKKTDFSLSKGPANGIVYIPYDLAGAVKDVNPQLLQRGENYIESYLFQVPVSSLFEDAIRDALKLTREKLMDVVKLPRIRANVKVSRDLVIGEEFPYSITIENIGEGIAQAISYSVELPSRIKLIAGQLKGGIDELEVQGTHSFDLRFICPTGEGEDQFFQEMNITVEFTDVIGNVRTMTLGPFEMEFKTFRVKDQLNQEIIELENEFTELITTLKSLPKEESAKSLSESLLSGFNTFLTQARQGITEEEFEAVKVSLSSGRILMEKIATQSLNVLKEYQNTLEETFVFIDKAEEQINRLEHQINELMSSLRS
ncbi:MAG: hypothetical protein ACFFCQ_11885 [Promethearchaeota archaeon]